MKLTHGKYMELNKIKAIRAKIINKKMNGDFVVLSKVLNVNINTAVARFNRNNKEAVLTMKKIVESREKLIKKLSESHGNFK